MMISEKNLTDAEKKRIESLDKRIEKIQNKIIAKRKEYDAMTEELQKLLEERYPEKSAMTAAGILRLVKEIRNCDCNIRITGEKKELKPEQVTEEYLQEHIRNGNE